MQPQRSVVTTPASAVLNAINTHPALSMRGGDSARLLWRVCAERADYRTGVVPASETELAQAIGKARKESLWASNGSPGPMDRLVAIGAVVRDGDALWFVRMPADVDKPRPAAPMDPQPLLIADADDDLPPDTMPISGVPRDSRNSVGGKGGRCAPELSIPKKQEQETSCSYSSESRDSRGSPATWRDARSRLIEAGVYAGIVSKLIASCDSNNCKPRDVLALCEYFKSNPNRLDLNAGALKIACEEWRPNMEYDAPGLWPQVKLPTIATGEKSPIQLRDEYEHRKILRLRELTKEGMNRKQINAKLIDENLGDIALLENGGSCAEQLRLALKRQSVPGNESNQLTH